MASSPLLRRRLFLAGLLAACGLGPAKAAARRVRIAFADLDETAGATVDGLGFTASDLRGSFDLAARNLPVDMLYFDNAGDPARAVANAKAAIAAKVDLLIEYNADAEANAEIARLLAAAGIPALALFDPLPGAPLYGPDNHAAGLIAGRALAAFGLENWPGQPVLGVLIGDLADPGPAVKDRVQAITEGVHQSLPKLKLAALDTGGQSVRADALLTKFLRTETDQKLLIATLDDVAAIYAKNAIEMNRRQGDCIIVSQGLDPNIHGGMTEKKEIDPQNRGSVVLGSVAYYIDRYGDEVLPLALRILGGKPVPKHTMTHHILVTGANVFREYPPIDMN
jgi:ribose transport system substrate-binding protein